MKQTLFMIVALLLPWPMLADDAPAIAGVQYWIDNDYDAAVTENVEEFDVNCSSLSAGLHMLHLRAVDSNGKYSQLYEYGFLKVENATKAQAIESLQYWWDDMSENAVTAPYTAEEFTLSTNALPYGLHSLKFRVKDDAGRWSDLKSHYFYKGEALEPACIVSYSYWWNDMADKVVTKQLDEPVASFVIDEDLTLPKEARTGYAGHYTATLNVCVTDNRGKIVYLTTNVEYPDNDAPTTDIDAAAYLGSASSGVKITWEEKSNDKMGDYNVYVSKDEGPFFLWLPDTTETSSLFRGEAGSTYRFTVTGRDAFGNREKYDETKCVSVTFE